MSDQEDRLREVLDGVDLESVKFWLSWRWRDLWRP